MSRLSLAILLPFAIAQIAFAAKTIPSAWLSKGCYKETTGTRQLPEAYLSAPDMTPEKCHDFCSVYNFHFAGVEYGKECWCGKGISSPLEFDFSLPSKCNMPCAGSSQETCGGPYLIDIYENPAPFAGPFMSTGANGYIFPQCYVDQVSDRVLPVLANDQASPVSVDLCTKACKAKNFPYAGLEYGGECFCGNTKPSPSLKRHYTECAKMACDGNKNEYCGGADRILVYETVSESAWATGGVLVRVTE
ncbi:WSC domain-containing protein [Pterulicium gracile]|uniref:WSC domain-containing protein n=1 Tax=Pterulicium gracile TaxID=1884261 RepID=A0A5C3QLX1_9AGAR|nr:WSC domain-containing protein [Pterula gracilis]